MVIVQQKSDKINTHRIESINDSFEKHRILFLQFFILKLKLILDAVPNASCGWQVKLAQRRKAHFDPTPSTCAITNFNT